ncbi:hypothetical protein [Mycolicibacterium lutetiense]
MVVHATRAQECCPAQGFAPDIVERCRANRRLAGGDIAISLTPMDRGFDDALTVIEDYRATSGR